MISRPCPRALEESIDQQKASECGLGPMLSTQIRVCQRLSVRLGLDRQHPCPKVMCPQQRGQQCPYTVRLLTRGHVRSNEGPPGPFPHEPAEPPPLLKSVWIERWKPSCVAGFRPGTCPSFSIGLRSTTQKIPIRRPKPDHAAALSRDTAILLATDLPEQGGRLHGAY